MQSLPSKISESSKLDTEVVATSWVAIILQEGNGASSCASLRICGGWEWLWPDFQVLPQLKSDEWMERIHVKQEDKREQSI